MTKRPQNDANVEKKLPFAVCFMRLCHVDACRMSFSWRASFPPIMGRLVQFGGRSLCTVHGITSLCTHNLKVMWRINVCVIYAWGPEEDVKLRTHYNLLEMTWVPKMNANKQNHFEDLNASPHIWSRYSGCWCAFKLKFSSCPVSKHTHTHTHTRTHARTHPHTLFSLYIYFPPSLSFSRSATTAIRKWMISKLKTRNNVERK